MNIRYSIDTRSIKPGEYYVAIRGERYDGHDYIEEAVNKGAKGLVVERKSVQSSDFPDIPIKIVEDCSVYIAEQARNRIKELGSKVVLITGSVGKTTTKNAIVDVLVPHLEVMSPSGNLNTLLGISLTILNHLVDSNQILVAEVGTYQVGNIANLCSYIKSHIAVVTNVHPVHLSRMKTIQNIALAKSELVSSLPKHGVACLNWDDPFVRPMSKLVKGRTVSYSMSNEFADVTPRYINVELPSLGEYQIYSALAAFCIGKEFGISSEHINQSLANLRPIKGRLNLLCGLEGAIIIDDSYNASDISTFEALRVLGNYPGKRRIAILGDMLELGDRELDAHQQTIKHAAGLVDILVLVGSRMNVAAYELGINKSRTIFIHAKPTEISQFITKRQVNFPKPGDIILVKGSAGMRMENVVEHLLHPDIDPTTVLVRQESQWKTI